MYIVAFLVQRDCNSLNIIQKSVHDFHIATNTVKRGNQIMVPGPVNMEKSDAVFSRSALRLSPVYLILIKLILLCSFKVVLKISTLSLRSVRGWMSRAHSLTYNLNLP